MPLESGYRSHGYLPHITVAGAAYFVTFRLADSLPREVVLRLKAQRDDLLERAAEHRQGVATTNRQLQAWYATEVDRMLDQHTGNACFRDSRLANLVAGAVRHFDRNRYELHAWCVMPNHVHVVLRPLGIHSLDAILHSWKSFTAHACNRLLGRTGDFWQPESYDHWIRDDVDFAHCCRYTEDNPINAKLCGKASDWPWSSAARK